MDSGNWCMCTLISAYLRVLVYVWVADLVREEKAYRSVSKACSHKFCEPDPHLQRRLEKAKAKAEAVEVERRLEDEVKRNGDK